MYVSSTGDNHVPILAERGDCVKSRVCSTSTCYDSKVTYERQKPIRADGKVHNDISPTTDVRSAF
ncbi:hypothetical protein BAUCODRAFT_119612 [Baudoinia panamericana UAMH 10762]|uniref:Uncharacterized protein n=1 Tax=Baudoinia panamericana (strain UAMH 10762) TaxID=717646 RepID=M2LZE8_BAUPA|nr:uncharacterized protein BAUCODRAFT_119612 [Baudoinia panamericana UAMH 10762]EMD00053.1 hypothetical protein BAUCODRAFT_119612 [Baudoinia panamericana UAMH 10762]